MSKPDVEVTLFPSAFKRIDRAAATALEKTAEAVLTEVKAAQVIPFQSGHLQNDATATNNAESSRGVVYIESSTPYARRLYYHPEYNFSHDENAHARGRWYEPWVSGSEKGFARNAFEEFLKEGL